MSRRTLAAATAALMIANAAGAAAQTDGAKPQPEAPLIYPEITEAVIGKDVFSATGEPVGEIAGVLVDDQGQPVTALIDHGGWLGLGDKIVAVDWSMVTVGANGVRVRMVEQEIAQLPEYDEPDDEAQ